MSTTAGRSEAGNIAEINMTPLIDVMLVLLIIFIITIPPMTHAVKIDNPRPAPSPPTPPDVIRLAIDFDGRLLWDETVVDRATMQRYVGVEAAKSPQPEVQITVDRFARYQAVAEALADLQRRGLRKIGFVNNETD